MIDDFYWEDIPCYAPSDLLASAIASDSAVISWTENGEATQWQYRLDTLGFDTTGVTPVLTSDNPLSVTSLLANTTYEFYLRTYCAAGDSSEWVGPMAFTTLCDPMSAELFENFDGVNADTLPDCWFTHVSDTVGFVGTIDSIAFSALNSVLLFNDSLSSGFFGLISPELSDLSAMTNQIRFQARVLSDSASLFIGTMSHPSDTASFTHLDTLLIRDLFEEHIVKFDQYSGSDNFIALRHGLDSASYILIDDFYWEKLPYLTLNTTDTSTGKLADTIDIYVGSNTHWLSSESASWFHLEPANGYQDDTVSGNHSN